MKDGSDQSASGKFSLYRQQSRACRRFEHQFAREEARSNALRHAMRRDASVIALARLKQCVDAVADTVGEQCHLLILRHSGESIPKRLWFIRQPFTPMFVPRLDRLAPDTLAQVRCDIAEPGLGDADLHTAMSPVRTEH